MTITPALGSAVTVKVTVIETKFSGLGTAHTSPERPTKWPCRDSGNMVVEAAGIELD